MPNAPAPIILVVDDTEANRYTLVRHLRRAGFEILEAATGKEALRLAEQRPDLVILDVKLPDILGYDVCRMLKQNPVTAAIPVLHISATFQMSSDKVKGLEGGADGYLTGPVEPEEMLANVRLLLRLRQANDSLRRANTRLNMVLSSITDAYFSLDRSGCILDANQVAAQQFFQCPASALIGQNLWKKFPQSQTTEFHSQCRQALALGQPVHWEGQSIPAERWFEIHLHPAGDRLEVYARDIHERTQAEAALRESEARFRTLADASPVMTWVTDAQGRIQFVNRAYCDFFGVTSEQVKGPEGWQPLVHSEDLPHYVSAFRDALRACQPFRAEARVRRADGEWRWIASYGAPRISAAGQCLGMVGSSPDITELKSAEQLLGSEAKRLEQVVRERTAELQKMVTELEHFSYSITHDMRAPLRAMQGYGQILLNECRDSLNPGHQHYLKRIVAAADRMDHLITDALSYSKAVRYELELVPINPDALLRGMVESYPDYQLPKAQVQIIGPIPQVLGNEAALTQCFSNLLGNAVKFVAPGILPLVRIWAEERVATSIPEEPAKHLPLASTNPPPAPAPVVRIWFADNGIGIPKRDQERLFGMFQKLNNTYEGTGIGLALVRKVTERMGGQVGLESEPGQGSRFWVELRKADPQPV